MTESLPVPAAPLDLAVEVPRLRARRAALISAGDIEAFESAADAVLWDMEAHPGEDGGAVLKAVLLGLLVIAAGFIVGGVLFVMGDSLLEYFDA